MASASASNSHGMPTRTLSLHKCINTMYSTMASLHLDGFGGCSVSFVPEQLQKSKVEAYMPQVVSIGPLHWGTNKNFLYMEEIKWRCAKYLFQRANKDLQDILSDCMDSTVYANDMFRACYNTYEIKFNCNELAKIMVLDGCFLLELLICGSPELNDQLKGNYGPSPGVEVIKWEKVLSDLTMVENQIPLMILEVLSGNLFPEIFSGNDTDKLIQKHALSILGYSIPDDSAFKAFHFLDLVHQNLKKSIGNGEAADTSHRKQKLQRCATRLEAAGVTTNPPTAANGQMVITIESPEAQREAANMAAGVTTEPPEAQREATNMDVAVNVPRAAETRFDLKVTFGDGRLEIPPLHITETTEAKWRNFIAWELSRTTLEKQRGMRKEDRISCQFISYAWFFQGLICSVHDVKLLRDRKVILVQEVESDKGKKKIMSDEDLLNLFRNITEGVPDAEIDMDSRFAQVIKYLNKYSTPEDRSSETRCKIIANRVTGTSKITWHIFRCFLTWIWYQCRGAYRGLKRVYFPSGWKLIAVFAASLALSSAIIQTVFTVFGYYHGLG